jgi:hypothetical protein
MQYQLNDPDRDNLAEVRRNAQHRRAEEMGMLLRHFLWRRRRLRSIDSVTSVRAATPDAVRYAGGAR